MSATDTLRQDHVYARRIEKLVSVASKMLYSSRHVPISDIQRITVIIEDFFDSIHYSREEDSYFACVAGYDKLKKEIRIFMIEHEFARRIASKLKFYLNEWKSGKDSREPIARFLRTYSIYLIDHLEKEDKFFDQASKTILSKEEESEMYQLFNSSISIATRISDIIKELDDLENQSWFIDNQDIYDVKIKKQT